jgi:hypothetical protein
MRRFLLTLALLAFLTVPVLAQESASYRLERSSFDAGGGSRMTSTSYAVSFQGTGEPALGDGLSSPSFRSDGSFFAAYAPAGEVRGLTIAADHETLSWFAEPVAGDYNLYRDLVGGLPGDFGSCLVADVEGTSWTDPERPPDSSGFFYLVTAENRLDEEGTKGWTSAGSERANDTPCP